MEKWVCILLVLLAGCSEQGKTQIGKFESSDMANKVIVLLAHYKVKAVLSSRRTIILLASTIIWKLKRVKY